MLRPPDDWPDVLDLLAIVLVADKYTKLGEKSENSARVVLYKNPTVSMYLNI